MTTVRGGVELDEVLASSLEKGSLRCPYDGQLCNIAYCRINRTNRCSPGKRVLDAVERLGKEKD
jgi:hypothetical protein